MSGLSLQQHVRAPRDEVFHRAIDFANAPARISAIQHVEMLTEGPVGVGTRFRETRLLFKREASEILEIVEFEPPERYVLGCESHGCRYRTEVVFTPCGEGTEVQMAFDAEPLTVRAKIVSFLFRPMIGMVARQCGRDLEELGRAVEVEVGALHSG